MSKKKLNSSSIFSRISKKIDESEVLDPFFLGKKFTKILLAILILIIFHIVGSLISQNIIKWNLNKNDEKDEIIRPNNEVLINRRNAISILSRVIYYLIMLFGLVIVFYMFGLGVGNIVAIISVIGFIIGISLQGTLSDIVSGIMLSFFQTYHTGDFVRTPEFEGRVIDFRLINTVIKDFEGIIVSIPNHKMQSNVVLNLSATGFYVHQIILNVDNNNIKFNDIYDIIKTDLENEEKYPEILREGKYIPKIEVDVIGMQGWTTQIRVRIPLPTVSRTILDRGSVFAKLRNTLQEKGIQTLSRTLAHDDSIDYDIVDKDE